MSRPAPDTVFGFALLAAAALAAGCSPGPSGRSGPAVTVYVTNEVSGDLTVIDGLARKVIETVPLGKRPRGIKVSPDRRWLYVALSGSPIGGPGIDRKTLPPADRKADGIGQVDVATRRLVRVIAAGADPEQLDVSADGSRLYVANEDTAEVSVVDAAAGSVIKTIPVGGEPEGVTLRPDGRVVYVTCEDDGEVHAIDTASNAVVARIPVGRRPRSVAFLPDGSRAYVTLENDGAVAVVDAARHALIETIPLGAPDAPRRPRPMGAAIPADGTLVAVTSGSFGSLFLLDPAGTAAPASLPVGTRPWGVAFTSDGRTLFTANGPSNDVSVVDVAERRVLGKVPAGNRPWGVAVLERSEPGGK